MRERESARKNEEKKLQPIKLFKYVRFQFHFKYKHLSCKPHLHLDGYSMVQVHKLKTYDPQKEHVFLTDICPCLSSEESALCNYIMHRAVFRDKQKSV